MSLLFMRLRAKSSTASQFTSDLAQWTVILCLSFVLLFSSCSKNPPSSTANDSDVLARERARIEAEKRAEREAIIQGLLARNIPADTDSEKMLASFRQAYPYHSQTLALSAPSADESRTLIVSEPPPHLTTGDILFPLGGLVRNHSEQKQKIGYDGWVKDLVIEIAGNKQEIDSAISSLNRLIFYTSYKSYVLPLPVKTLNKTPFNLDLQVTSAELKSWVLDKKEMFTAIEGGDSLSLEQVFEQKVSGVFYGDGGGVVGWWIPKGRTIDDCRIQARQFALDSDLIVGALSKPEGILVLGRNRIVPVDLLPPLRVETLSLLAAVQQGQSGKLVQSYERNYMFAGRIDGHNDWAPILLSPELRDTEYGSLLNITDQLLKGWSNSGYTNYYNFKYPRPKSFPFKGLSLITRLDTDELTYNWNTRGAGYTVEVGDYGLLALNRTGALPVSYIPEGQEAQASTAVSDAEEEAYNYFARLNDPNLVRVVQYAAMYQIFSAFDVARPSTPVASTSFPDQKLEELAGALMSEIRSASPQQLAVLARQLTPLVAGQLDEKSAYQKLLNDSLAERRRHIAQVLREAGFEEGTPEFNATINAQLAKDRAELQREINEELTRSRNELGETIKNQLEKAAAGVEADNQDDRFVRSLALSQLAGLRKLPQNYAEAVDSVFNGWIHTPSVVISWNSDSKIGETAIGGHNLDAKVTRFRVSEDVVPGTTRIDGEGDILVNPRDINKVNKVVRTAGRAEGESPYGLSAELDNALRNVSEAPPRPMAAALDLPASPPLPPKGPPRLPLTFDLPGPGFDGENWYTGWGRPRSQLEPDPLLALLRQRRTEIPGVIIVERDSTGLISIANTEKSAAIKAYTVEDAVDVVVQFMRKGPDDMQPLQVDFKGFQEHEVRGFTKSCEIRAADEKIPREISGIVDEAGGGGGNGSKLPPRDGEAGTGGSNRGSDGGGNDEGGGSDGNSGAGSNNELPLALRQRRYNFSKAEVAVHPDIEVLPNGMQRSRIIVEVPAADAGTAGHSTIELGFRKTTPREAVMAGTRRVADSVRNFIKGVRDEYQALRFNLRLNSEIKRISKEMDIDINLIRHSFNDGKGDLYFARREERNGPSAPDTAAC